jgi:two-component system sensor histidine kinase HydH
MSMTTARVRTGDAERMSTSEVARVLRLGLRFRAAAVLSLLGLGALLWTLTDAWRGMACIAAAIPALVLSLLELRASHDPWRTPAGAIVFGASVAIMHFTVIVVSGGITSPWAVLLPMLGLFQGVIIGRPRPVFAVGATLSGFSCILGVVALVAPGFEPAPLARGPAPPALVMVITLLLVVAPLLASAVGLRVREALERAVARASEAQSRLLESTRERNDELLALAGGLAHELKNPLAAIRGLAALQARKLENGSKQAEQMGVLLDEVARMGSILDELSNFSRPARGLALEPVDPARVVAEIVHIHEPLAEGRGVRLIAHVERTAPIVCDPRKLKQILVNLLQNAIDASAMGGEVATHVRADRGWHSLRIEDRGCGLADAVRGRLFTPGATTKIAGSGLGLTIARAIAEQHGGSLTLSERAGGGCVAEVRLPSRPPEGDGEAAP